MITTVWAVKPDKPHGKPSDPETVIADYDIWIGDVDEDEDIVLVSTDYIFVEGVEGGYWLPPPTKGKNPKARVWRIDLISVEEDDCGKYDIADVLGEPPYDEKGLSTILDDDHGIDDETEAIFFSIEHVQKRSPYGGVSDYWLIQIAWQVGTVPGTDIHQIHGIMCWTDMDAECEGVYYFDDDVWIVTFEDAEAGLLENSDVDDEQPILSTLWEGTLSFTVTIERTT